MIRDADSMASSRVFEDRGDTVSGADVGDVLMLRISVPFTLKLR